METSEWKMWGVVRDDTKQILATFQTNPMAEDFVTYWNIRKVVKIIRVGPSNIEAGKDMIFWKGDI